MNPFEELQRQTNAYHRQQRLLWRFLYVTTAFVMALLGLNVIASHERVEAGTVSFMVSLWGYPNTGFFGWVMLVCGLMLASVRPSRLYVFIALTIPLAAYLIMGVIGAVNGTISWSGAAISGFILVILVVLTVLGGGSDAD